LALRFTQPQRFSPRIKEWEYRLRENPGLGEFRYLRFAWNSVGAKRIMVELANNGAWPDANSSNCRYLAGRNTTPWQALEVSPQAPAEWTIVIRDV
jgi:hypothetical protein